MGKKLTDLTPSVAGDMSQQDLLMVWNHEDGTTRRLPVSEFQTSNLTNGYWFHNSKFYLEGHANSDDVLEDVAEGAVSVFKVSSPTPGESGNELPVGLPEPYDTATGQFTLTGLKETDMLQFRFAVDIECFSDESSADIKLTVDSPLGFSFDIDEQFITMSDGAGDYEGLVTIPVFAGAAMADNGTPAVVTPSLTLNKTTGVIKPRGIVLYVWR